MNNSETVTRQATGEPQSAKGLLEEIIRARATVGDGLNDDEFTRLLRRSELPKECGFEFVSFCNRSAMFAVPPQEIKNWHPDQGWIASDKEKMAKEIARKYGLSFSEPPDTSFASDKSPTRRHHIELTNEWETVVVAHPEYLKVRVFGVTNPRGHGNTTARPLGFGPDLLKDLAKFYSSNTAQESPQ